MWYHCHLWWTPVLVNTLRYLDSFCSGDILIFCVFVVEIIQYQQVVVIGGLVWNYTIFIFIQKLWIRFPFSCWMATVVLSNLCAKVWLGSFFGSGRISWISWISILSMFAFFTSPVNLLCQIPSSLQTKSKSLWIKKRKTFRGYKLNQLNTLIGTPYSILWVESWD